MLKIKDTFMLREVDGNSVVVSIDNSFNGLITLNETGTFLWNLMANGTDEDSMVEAMLKEYEVVEDVARADVREFIETARKSGVLDE